MRTKTWMTCAAGLLIAGSVVAFAPPKHGEQPSRGGFPDLVGALKASEGCLGVETAKTSSGKNVIFAWFEDKQAVVDWFYSDAHQAAMAMAFSGYEPGEPLDEVADGTGPIMAIASITMAKEAELKETGLPISQIAIELYEPITGGLFLGSRFAPEGVKVKNIKNYTPGAKETADN